MPISLSRRRFLVGTAGAVAAAALGDGFLIEPTDIEVTRHDLTVPGLPHELEGFRIACITDVHRHRGTHRPARATLALLERERPHLVAMIGDICNHFGDLEHLTAFARAARGSVATVATLGNWEHDAGIHRATAERAYGVAGAELLYNTTRAGRGGAKGLGVGGVLYFGLGHPHVGEADPRHAGGTRADR